MKKKHYLLFVCFCALLCAGCSNHVSVKGKVTFPDGEPLTKGTVQFLTPTYVATGAIQPDGSYVIGSFKDSDGLPRGTYTVTVSAYETVEAPNDGNQMFAAAPATQRSLIDLKHSSREASGLTCDVQGSTVFNITVEPPK